MERTPMEKALSTDVIMDIMMNYLKVRDLLACRRVSKFWKKAASSVLRRRSTMMDISNTKTLAEIGNCMKKNPDFPFAGLRFCEPWKMSTAEAMQFVEKYGGRFTSLGLNTYSTRLQDLAPLVNHLPHLTILDLRLSFTRPPRGEVSDPADSKVLDLSVGTIRISLSFPGQNEDHVVESNKDLLGEVFKAASCSKLRIECLDATYGILSALQSAGKLQDVSVMNISTEKKPNDDTLRVDEWLSTQTPALTKLDWNAGGCISRKGLMRLLISSQKTLKYLRLAGLCPSQLSSECPVLTKLTTLSLCLVDQSYEYVFQGSQGHKFPALKELKLDTTCFEYYTAMNRRIAKMSDDVFIVPSVKTIDLQGPVDRKGIEDLARSFPKVIGIRLMHQFWLAIGSDPSEIWSVGAFKFLEKLTIWDYTIQPPKWVLDGLDNKINPKTYISMDSFLTGIPTTICENLRKHNQRNSEAYPFNEILRDSPSLAQLENLKELIVCVRLQNASQELPDDDPFISMVSVRYALDLMPKLTAKFAYKHSSPSRDFKEERRDEVVTLLKTAFKEVKSCVELEPFFY